MRRDTKPVAIQWLYMFHYLGVMLRGEKVPDRFWSFINSIGR